MSASHVGGRVRTSRAEQEAAVAVLARAAQLQPDDPYAHYQLGLALLRLDQPKFAVVNLERAIGLKADFAQAHGHLGYALSKLDEPDAALAASDRAVALEPATASLWTLRGEVLNHGCRYGEALEAFERAIALSPCDPEAHVGKSVAHLARLELTAGWRAFEWRWLDIKDDILESGKPEWQGGASDKSLWVWSVHGPGDEVRYASLLPWLATFPQKKLVSVDRRLIPVFDRSFPGMQFIANDSPPAPELFDEQLLLGSLPRLFLSSVEDFARRSFPYLRADAARRERLRGFLKKPGRLVCGLSWFSTHPKFGAHKSLTLTQLAPVLKVSDVDFVELQYGETRAEREELKSEHGIELIKVEEIDNFADIDGLVALVDACDVVVTTSNVTAHIAGALGKATLLLAPHARTVSWVWCHMQEHGRSLWYRDVRVFEQNSAGDWGVALEGVRRALEARSIGRD